MKWEAQLLVAATGVANLYNIGHHIKVCRDGARLQKLALVNHPYSFGGVVHPHMPLPEKIFRFPSEPK